MQMMQWCKAIICVSWFQWRLLCTYLYELSYRNSENASIICNKSGVFKPLSKFGDFSDTLGHLCHDCYSKDWRDNTKKCNQCDTYQPVNLFKDFSNGFFGNSCISCRKGNQREHNQESYDKHQDAIKQQKKEYYTQHKDEINRMQKEKWARQNPKLERINVDTLASTDMKELVHEQLTSKKLNEIAKLFNITLWPNINRSQIIDLLVKLCILSKLALPQAKPRPSGMKLSTKPAVLVECS
jgi:hypothetical protein